MDGAKNVGIGTFVFSYASFARMTRVGDDVGTGGFCNEKNGKDGKDGNTIGSKRTLDFSRDEDSIVSSKEE